MKIVKYQGFRNSVNGRGIGRVGRQWMHFWIVGEGGADSLKFTRGWRFSQYMNQYCFIKAQILMAILAVFNIWMFFINHFWEGYFIFKQNGEWIIFCEKGASFVWENTSWRNLLWWRRVLKKSYGVGFTTKIIILVKTYTNEKYWRVSVLFLFSITWKFLHIQYLFT